MEDRYKIENFFKECPKVTKDGIECLSISFQKNMGGINALKPKRYTTFVPIELAKEESYKEFWETFENNKIEDTHV